MKPSEPTRINRNLERLQNQIDPKYVKDELVLVEKRAMSIICPGMPYQETIELVNIVLIVDFITGLCRNTFDTIIKDPEQINTI